MENKWKRIGLLAGMLFVASSTVFANEEPAIDHKKMEEKSTEYHHFTPVTYESLSESEKEFV